jgi:Fe-S-cluster containining protein
MDPARRVAERRALLELDAIFRATEALYSGWSCARSGECCQLAKTGREPYAWPVEWLRVRAALARAGRAPPPAREDGACRLLDAQGRCSVYADRPLGCRTFYCDRGHGPRAVKREEITALMVRLERVAQDLDPDETSPTRLAEWLDPG